MYFSCLKDVSFQGPQKFVLFVCWLFFFNKITCFAKGCWPGKLISAYPCEQIQPLCKFPVCLLLLRCFSEPQIEEKGLCICFTRIRMTIYSTMWGSLMTAFVMCLLVSKELDWESQFSPHDPAGDHSLLFNKMFSLSMMLWQHHLCILFLFKTSVFSTFIFEGVLIINLE